MVVQQLVMVVVVVLCVEAAALAAPEGAAAAAAACPAADITNTIINGEAVLLNITPSPDFDGGAFYWYRSLFVSPGHGFQGLRFVWRAGDWEYKVWLHVPKTCMTLDSNMWWEAEVYGDTREHISISKLRVGSCYLFCQTTLPNTPPDGARTAVVSAVGPSRWTQQDPASHCTNTTTTKIDWDAEWTDPDTCREPFNTTTTTTTTPTTTTTITTPTTTTTTITTRELVLTIALGTSLSVVVVLVVVVVVVVVRRKRTTADTPPQAACSDTVHAGCLDPLSRGRKMGGALLPAEAVRPADGSCLRPTV